MFIKKENYYIIKEFEDFKLNAIFTTKAQGSMSPFHNSKKEKELIDFLNKIKLDNKKIIYAEQTHSDNIVVLGENIQKIYEDTDGFVTNRKDIVIATFYADCLPVYAYDKVNEVIGLCHSGWLGSFKEISTKLIETMILEYGSKVEDIIVQLGIGMGGDVYEVGKEFKEKFEDKFSKDLIIKVFSEKDNKLLFDNQLFNKELLIKKGVKNIMTSELCTYKNEEFHSYRREGAKAGRNGAIFSFK
jgi:hypothetical protein